MAPTASIHSSLTRISHTAPSLQQGASNDLGDGRMPPPTVLLSIKQASDHLSLSLTNSSNTDFPYAHLKVKNQGL